jgi:transposase
MDAQQGLLTMSNKEYERMKIMEKVKEKSVRQKEAGDVMGIGDRQVRRLLVQYNEKGVLGILSQQRGKPSNRQIAQEEKDKVLAIIREQYPGFGPTLAHEKLLEKGLIPFSVETLRQAMMQSGLWKGKQKKTGPVYQQRMRRGKLGELVQIDGSPHKWFGEESCELLAGVDDATSNIMHLKFVDSESIESYFAFTEEYLSLHGRPEALYSDRHSIFVTTRKPTIDEQLAKQYPKTQYGRAMEEIGIELICARTPQAKGRIERCFKTLQDRLVKELKLERITTREEANAYLPTFIASYNKKFAVPAREQENAHRAVHQTLKEILVIKSTRKVSKQLEVQYEHLTYQLHVPKNSLALRGVHVHVHKTMQGEVSIIYREKKIPFTTLDVLQQNNLKSMSKKEVNVHLNKKTSIPHKPSNNHPWSNPSSLYA